MATQLAKLNYLSQTHGHVQSAPDQAKKTTACRIFRDISSEEEQMDRASFPHIIGRCGEHSPRLVSRLVGNMTDGNTSSTDRNTTVPNVLHYVWFGPPMEMTFLNYLSIKSVDKFLKPQYIFIHGDSSPTGRWWDKTIATIPNIHLVTRPKPASINGQTPRHPQHYADIARLEILLGMCGI